MKRRPGYTLVELVLGLATSAVLLGGLSSAMIIATRAMPDTKSPLTATVDTAAAADQLTTDLYTAHTVTAFGPRVIEFRVADRNNDQCPEVIRYEWSGVGGQPLTRTYNDGSPQTAVADVYEFELTFDQTPFPTLVTPGANESEETLLISNIGPKPRANWATTSSAWIGQYFVPTLPVNATSWKITRVELLLRTNGANNGIARVELRYPDSNKKPTGALIADANILERELSTNYLWRQVSFASPPAISASSGACLVVKWLYDVQAMDVQYQSSRTVSNDEKFITTTDAGASWNTVPNQGLLYKIYGTATAASKPTVPKLYTINAIHLKMRAGQSGAARVEATVTLPNEPEVTGS